MVDRGVILAQLALKVAGTPAEEPLVRRLCQACVDILDVHGVALTIGYTTEDRVTVCTTESHGGPARGPPGGLGGGARTGRFQGRAPGQRAVAVGGGEVAAAERARGLAAGHRGGAGAATQRGS